jgi:hypothetical protein
VLDINTLEKRILTLGIVSLLFLLTVTQSVSAIGLIVETPQGCANAKQGSSFMEDYMCFPSGGSGSTTSPGETNIDFKAACDILSPALYQPCSSYVNPDGSLTKEGQRAYDCIKGGFVLGLGGLLLSGGDVPAVTASLGILAGFTGCGKVVHLELAAGLLGGDVGILNSL